MTDEQDVSEIESILISEIATILGKEESAITGQTPLKSLGVDSIRFVEILIVIEKRFSLKLMEIGITRETLENVSSLARCIADARK